jgi:protein O-mannosyl-transferase
VTLPLVLLLLDIYPLRRLGSGVNQWFGKPVRQVWFEKLPFLALSGGAAAIAITAKESTAAILSWENYGWISRLGQACYGLLFYLSKTIFPMGLSPLYQLTPEFGAQTIKLVLFGLAATVITAGFHLARRKSPAAWTGWLCYAAVLLPVLGIAQSGPQLTADRYSYLACMPWALLAAGWLYRLGRLNGTVRSKAKTMMALLLGIPLVIMFGILSWQQSRHWKNSATLWERVLHIDPNSTIAHNNLGNFLVDQGALEPAKNHYLRAIAIEPRYAQARVNLGMVLSRQGELQESTAHIRIALQNDPNNWQGHHALGINFAIVEAWEEAAEQFRGALRRAPHQSGIHVDLARVLARQGKIDQAVQHIEEAIRIRPGLLQERRELLRLLNLERKG